MPADRPFVMEYLEGESQSAQGEGRCPFPVAYILEQAVGVERGSQEQLVEPPAALSVIRPNLQIQAQLESAVMRAPIKHRAQRYEGATDFARASQKNTILEDAARKAVKEIVTASSCTSPAVLALGLPGVGVPSGEKLPRTQN